jgi:hypothetical protein
MLAADFFDAIVPLVWILGAIALAWLVIRRRK